MPTLGRREKGTLMRLIKLLLNLLLALLAVGITFGILVYLKPGWQKALLEEALKRDTARQWQVGEVRLGPRNVYARDVFVLDGPSGIEVGQLSLSGPFWRAPLTGVISVTGGAISGLLVDVSQVAVGDLTASDWQDFLRDLEDDLDFWEERIGLVLHKVAASNWDVVLRDVELRGQILMPGNRLIPVSWRIIEADSRSPDAVQIEPLAAVELSTGVLL
jgi:hypothetical protein